MTRLPQFKSESHRPSLPFLPRVHKFTWGDHDMSKKALRVERPSGADCFICVLLATLEDV